MKKKTIGSIALIGILLSCCNANSTNTNDKIIKTDITQDRDCFQVSLSPEEILEVKKHIEYQKRIETEDNINVYKMTDRDTELYSQLIIKSLIEQGYKVPSNTEFSERLKYIFNLDYNELNKPCNIVNHDKFFVYLVSQGNDDDYLEETEYDYTYDHIFFIKKEKFITWVPYLENVISEVDNNQIKICSEPQITHRNKYLFNNSQSSLTWLINNDLNFLQILVKEFGYDKDSKINKAVLNKINKEYRESGSKENKQALYNLFVKKDCYEALEIRENLLKFISEGKLDSIDSKYVKMIREYANSIDIGNYYGSKDLDKKLTKEEQFKILAYLTYYEQLYYDKHEDHNIHSESDGILSAASYIQSFFDPDSEIDLQINLEENNYYNLPGFKEMVARIMLKKAILRQG